jgi:hypothetical protein
MAILRSVDGKFYEVPDDKVESFLVPEDKVKEKLSGGKEGAAQAGPGRAAGGPPPGPSGGRGPQVVITILGEGQASLSPPPPSAGLGGQAAGMTAEAEVAPYGCWHNWHNWQNNWHNNWHNWQNWQNCGGW